MMAIAICSLMLPTYRRSASAAMTAPNNLKSEEDIQTGSVKTAGLLILITQSICCDKK
jgi:hypothetical protein